MLRRIYAMLIALSGILFSSASTVSEVTIQQHEDPVTPPALGQPSSVVSEVTVQRQPSYDPAATPIQFGFFGTALSEVLGQPDEAQERALVAAPSEPGPEG
jgi:hypothetical protein